MKKPQKSRKPYARKRPNRKKRFRSAHFVSPPGSMEITGFGRSLTYELLRNGTMPSVRIRNHWLIPRPALMEWLTSLGESAT